MTEAGSGLPHEASHVTGLSSQARAPGKAAMSNAAPAILSSDADATRKPRCVS